MKIIVGMLLVAMLPVGSGCAKTDWIDRTLVTVDVTGVWQGTTIREGAYGPGSITLTLQQAGSKVTGQAVLNTSQLPGSRSVEGTILGDKLQFHTSDGRLSGALQVSGDEMEGTGQSPAGQVRYSFRRQQ